MAELPLPCFLFTFVVFFLSVSQVTLPIVDAAENLDTDTANCLKTWSCLQINKFQRIQNPSTLRKIKEILDSCENVTNFKIMDELVSEQVCDRLVRKLEREQRHRDKRSALFNFDAYDVNMWDTEIYIKISDEFSSEQKEAIRWAARVWMDNTCIVFTEKKTEEYVDEVHLIFQKGTGCITFVAMGENREQPVLLSDYCFSPPGQIVRELGHALGLWDEHRRQDRDDYIIIFAENIIYGEEGNFARLPAQANVIDESYPYDLSSIMHYTPFAHVMTSGGYTMLPRNELFWQTIGQRVAPSFGDFLQLNDAYCSDSCRVMVTCKNGGTPHRGLTDGNKCRLCKCRDGFAMSGHCQDIEKYTFATIADSGNAKGAPCTFPFTYKGNTYRKCTTVKNDGVYWCSTAPTYNKYKKWGNCPADRDEDCGGEREAKVDEQAIMSPNYESNGEYMITQQCTWRIKPEQQFAGKSIRLRFDDRFDIYCKEGVAYHWVEIRYLDNILELGPRFCGQDTPSVVLDSNIPEVMVLFRAIYDNSEDGDRTRHYGFKLMYSIVPDCDTIPCDSEGGVCVMIDGAPSCDCKEGYTGLDCSERTCESTECLNGGTCVMSRGRPVCRCLDGYSGDDCGEFVCDDMVCYNGGTCEVRIGGAICLCEDGFTGIDCADVVGDGDCEWFAAKPGFLYQPIVIGQESHRVQVQCQYDSNCGFWDWRCRSSRSRDRCYDDVLLDTYGCCDRVIGLTLIEYCGQSYCAVEGWSEFDDCEGYTCGLCGVKRRYLYSIVSNGRTGPNQKNFYQECGLEARPCGSQPCSSCRNRRDSSSHSSASSSEERHERHPRHRRDIWGFLESLLGGGASCDDRGSTRCNVPCCEDATLNDATGLCELDIPFQATTPRAGPGLD